MNPARERHSKNHRLNLVLVALDALNQRGQEPLIRASDRSVRSDARNAPFVASDRS